MQQPVLQVEHNPQLGFEPQEQVGLVLAAWPDLAWHNSPGGLVGPDKVPTTWQTGPAPGMVLSRVVLCGFLLGSNQSWGAYEAWLGIKLAAVLTPQACTFYKRQAVLTCSGPEDNIAPACPAAPLASVQTVGSSQYGCGCDQCGAASGLQPTDRTPVQQQRRHTAAIGVFVQQGTCRTMHLPLCQVPGSWV